MGPRNNFNKAFPRGGKKGIVHWFSYPDVASIVCSRCQGSEGKIRINNSFHVGFTTLFKKHEEGAVRYSHQIFIRCSFAFI